MRILPPLACAILLFSGILPLAAQTAKPTPKPATPPAPAGPVVVPGKNVLRNSGFETTTIREDLWDGVDAAGFLSGERDQAPILTTNGDIANTAMPISVGIGDMNGDGLADLVTMDVMGYQRIFFNAGTATEPKFPYGEISPIFLSRTSFNAVPNDMASFYVRTAPRLGLVNTGSGKLDMYVGNYWGELFFLRNDGSGVKPEFRQPPGNPPDVTKLIIPTAKDSNAKWGNLFAPAVWDWNKDGKDDLLVGEGSYSANNIHLLINSGSSGRPVFEETNRTVIAFGDGREQLTPAVVDYNGDGNMDLLVSERTGKLALHLNKGEPWKPGVELPFTSLVSDSKGAQLSFGGIFTVTTGDLNGDGLFDIVAGKSNGRIAVAYNKGSKTEPKFDPPVELKGENATPPLKRPSGWDTEYGMERGNFYGFATTVTAEEDPDANPPEGKACLKFGYRASLNKVMSAPLASAYSGAFPEFKRDKALLGEHTTRSRLVLCDAPANMSLLRIYNFPITHNQAYTLSFKVKGTGVTSAQVVIGWEGRLTLSDAKVTVLDRGVEQKKNEAIEINGELITFNPSPAWIEVKKDFTTSFKDKRLNVEKLSLFRCALEISFALQPMQGKIYIDDVQIVAK